MTSNGGNNLPRDLLKWILALDLSFQIKNPKRDFTNGFLIAEILSRYYPNDINMHSFENVTCMDRKKSNWYLLKKFFKKNGFNVNFELIEAVMTAQDSAAIQLLNSLHSKLYTTESEAKSQQHENSQSLSNSSHTSQNNKESFLPPIQQNEKCNQLNKMRKVPSDPNILRMTGRREIMTNYNKRSNSIERCQNNLEYILQNPEELHFVNNLNGDDDRINVISSEDDESTSFEEREEIKFINKPRINNFKPYTMQDYRLSNFDIKTKRGYWELGKLGRDLNDPGIYDKKMNYIKMKEFACKVMKNNKEKDKLKRNQKEIKEENKIISSRERARAFSQTIPKPWKKLNANKEKKSNDDLNNKNIENQNECMIRDPVERRKRVNEIIERLKLRER